MRLPMILASVLMLSTSAKAGIMVRFEESAPKDRFTITNAGTCALPLTSLTIDLTGSAAGLIFDVTGSGAGVNVFQPFQLVTGEEHVLALPEVKDGDRAISLKLMGLGPNQRVVFTIDVDDTAGMTESMISGSEISGATVMAEATSGTFGANNTAIVKLPACTS